MKCRRQLVKFFFETFGEIGGTGETYFEGHIGYVAEIPLQQLVGPFEPEGLDKLIGRLAG